MFKNITCRGSTAGLHFEELNLFITLFFTCLFDRCKAMGKLTLSSVLQLESRKAYVQSRNVLNEFIFIILY